MLYWLHTLLAMINLDLMKSKKSWFPLRPALTEVRIHDFHGSFSHGDLHSRKNSLIRPIKKAISKSIAAPTLTASILAKELGCLIISDSPRAWARRGGTAAARQAWAWAKVLGKADGGEGVNAAKGAGSAVGTGAGGEHGGGRRGGQWCGQQ